MNLNLSIIIPNYNNEKYLEKCVNSILNQSKKPDEIIIVDDASTDNSKSIINKFSLKYKFIKPIYNSDNKGVVYSRNLGIKKANSKYITTLDSDDYLINSNKLKREINLIKKYKLEKNKDIIPYTNIVKIFDSENEKELVFNQNNKIEGNILFSLLTRNNPIPRDFIFKKSDYYKVGGYKNYPLYEDWDLKIKLSNLRDFYFINIEGIAYRQHDNGLSATNYKEHFQWINKIFLDNIHLLNLNKQIFAYIYFYKNMFNIFGNKYLRQYPSIYKFAKYIKYLLWRNTDER